MSYRAAIYRHPSGSETVLTGLEHAGLPDEDLLAEALAEARRHGLIGDERPQVPEDTFRRRLYVGVWEG
ncbi:MAG TPA: hypothetical protein VIL95_05950 [Bacillota bacterium]